MNLCCGRRYQILLHDILLFSEIYTHLKLYLGGVVIFFMGKSIRYYHTRSEHPAIQRLAITHTNIAYTCLSE